MYEVHKGRPMPVLAERTHTTGRTPKYPFGTMQVGDSFTASQQDGRNMKAAASAYGIRNNKRFVVRQQDDGTVMCWRVT